VNTPFAGIERARIIRGGELSRFSNFRGGGTVDESGYLIAQDCANLSARIKSSSGPNFNLRDNGMERLRSSGGLVGAAIIVGTEALTCLTLSG
jgi:hypothetical protein